EAAFLQQSPDIQRIVGHVPLAAAAVEGMSRGTGTQVGYALPVAGVVQGIMAGSGKIGDLVVVEPCRGCEFCQYPELQGSPLGIHRLRPALTDMMMQLRALFYG